MQPNSVNHQNPAHNNSPQSQRGVALLTILLLVVAITIVAGSMLASQRVMVRQYELTQNQGKFREYALAGEAYALQLITQDAKANQTDSFQDTWAKPIADYPVTGGHVHIQIQDDASRFNINNLYHDGKVDTQAVNYFKALLSYHGIEPSVAMAVLDWQDPDSQSSPEGGAEADYYQSTGKKMPMPIANQPLISVDELQYVRGMDAEKLAILKPVLTAVPYYLPININTAKPALLAILPSVNITESVNVPAPNQTAQTPNNAPSSAPQTTSSQSALNSSEVSRWADARKTAMPLDSVDKLWSVPAFAAVAPQQRQALAPLLDIQSRAFRTAIDVAVDDKHSYLTSQLTKLPAQPTATDGLPIGGLSVGQSSPAPLQIKAYNRQFLPIPMTLE